MRNQPPDPVIAELRSVRDEHAARFNYNVKAIFRDVQARQKASGRTYVRYPPKAYRSRPGQAGKPVTPF